MANPPSTKKKANTSARATGKGNNTTGHSTSKASKSKRIITDENADGILAKSQNTGVNGRQPREPQVLSTANSGGASGAAEAIPDGNEILQKYNELKGYPYICTIRQESYLPHTVQKNTKKKRPRELLLKSSWRVLEYREELKVTKTLSPNRLVQQVRTIVSKLRWAWPELSRSQKSTKL
jgi:hypothetical protein